MPRVQPTSAGSLSSLAPPRRRLVTLMQSLAFGRIEGLRIENREPVFTPSPRIVREVKLAAEDRDAVRREGDFLLKAQVLDLFREFDRLRDGTILVLEVKHGLPFRMMVGEALG